MTRSRLTLEQAKKKQRSAARSSCVAGFGGAFLAVAYAFGDLEESLDSDTLLVACIFLCIALSTVFLNLSNAMDDEVLRLENE